MRLALIGGKEVKGFDIKKHQAKQKFSDLEKPRDMEVDSQEESDAEQEPPVDEETEPVNPDEDLDTGFLEQGEILDPDAIMEQDEEDKMDDEEDNESMMVRQILKEEDINLVPESQDISEIDKLTGVPSRKDALQFGIPMLAPYTTIQSYKYKVKITPGTQKRGRVQKTIKDLFMKNSKDSKLEQ